MAIMDVDTCSTDATRTNGDASSAIVCSADKTYPENNPPLKTGKFALPSINHDVARKSVGAAKPSALQSIVDEKESVEASNDKEVMESIKVDRTGFLCSSKRLDSSNKNDFPSMFGHVYHSKKDTTTSRKAMVVHWLLLLCLVVFSLCYIFGYVSRFSLCLCVFCYFMCLV